MKKKSRNLIIMALALAILAGAYFTWRAVGGSGDVTDTSGGDTSYSVGAVDYKTLSFVSVSRRTEPGDGSCEPGRVEFEFRLNEGGSAWLWSEDENVPLDNEQFADMATAVSSLTSPYRLEGISTAELSKYGLDDPEITLAFTDDSGTHRFYIGAKSSFNGANYFCNDDKTTVYTVSSSVAETFRFGIFDLIKADEAPTMNASALTSLEYTDGDRKLLFTYYADGKASDYTGKYNWYVSENGGSETPVASDIGKALTSALTAIDLDNVVSYNNARDSEYGLDAGARLVLKYMKTTKVTDSTTNIEKEVKTPAEYVICIGKSEDGTVYARPEGSALTVKLSAQETFRNVTADNTRVLRANELVLPDYSRIDSMTFTCGGKTLTVKVTHGDDGSVSYSASGDGSPDSETLDALLGALADARTTAFASDLDRDPASGSETVFSVAFVFNTGGSANATLALSHYSENYYLVSFMSDSDRLITADGLKALTDAFDACVK